MYVFIRHVFCDTFKAISSLSCLPDSCDCWQGTSRATRSSQAKAKPITAGPMNLAPQLNGINIRTQCSLVSLSVTIKEKSQQSNKYTEGFFFSPSRMLMSFWNCFMLWVYLLFCDFKEGSTFPITFCTWLNFFFFNGYMFSIIWPSSGPSVLSPVTFPLIFFPFYHPYWIISSSNAPCPFCPLEQVREFDGEAVPSCLPLCLKSKSWAAAYYI